MSMHPFPHLYSASAQSTAGDDVMLRSPGLPTLRSAAPAAFDGPGDQWSPETLLVAAIADCYVLTFRAMAQASKLPWISLDCDVEGTLDRIDRRTQFTGCTLRVRLRLPEGADEAQARRLLDKAEQGCLVTNSLKFVPHLEPDLEFVPAAQPAVHWHEID